jgi:hypothetical protein
VSAVGKGGGKLFKAALEAAGDGSPLIRKAGAMAGKQADNVAKEAGQETAEKAGKKAAKMSKDDAIKAARKERDKVADELRDKSRKERKQWVKDRNDGRRPTNAGPSTVTGATDPETGISKAGVNSARVGQPRTDVDVCAEDDALYQINKEREALGLEPKKRNEVYYSEATDLNTGGEKDICAPNCQNVSDPKQYPDGVGRQPEYERPDGTVVKGRWSDPNRQDLPGGIG